MCTPLFQVCGQPCGAWRRCCGSDLSLGSLCSLGEHVRFILSGKAGLAFGGLALCALSDDLLTPYLQIVHTMCVSAAKGTDDAASSVQKDASFFTLPSGPHSGFQAQSSPRYLPPRSVLLFYHTKFGTPGFAPTISCFPHLGEKRSGLYPYIPVTFLEPRKTLQFKV